MLTTKKRVPALSTFFLSIWVMAGLTGCAPPGPRALLDGEKFIREGNFVQAIHKLEDAVKLLPESTPANAQAWNHLGLAYHGAGRTNDAVQAYRQALTRNRNLSVVHYNLGCLYLEHNNLNPAVEELTRFTLIKADSLDGWLKLGAAELRSRQFDAAEKSYTQALKLKPRLPEALNGLGIVQLQRKRYREAYNQFLAALQQQPNYRPALLNLAVVSHQYLNFRPFALQKYREYIALQPAPENLAAVQAIVRQLDSEINPPPRPVFTNQITQVANQATVVTNTATPAPSTSSPPRNVTIASPGVVPATRKESETRPVQSIPKSEPKEEPTPTIKLQQPPQPASQQPVPEIASQPPLSATNITASPDSTAAPDTLSRQKPGVLQRLNPQTWFRSKEKSVTPLPSTVEKTVGKSVPVPKTDQALNTNPATTAAAKPSGPTPLPPRLAPARYKYQSFANPAPGNRQEAERFFADGVQFHEKGRLAAAVASYRSATQADPTFFDAHYNLGLAAYQAGDLPQAISAYEHALSLNSASLNSRYNFALALQKANYPRDAANELEKLLAEYPSETRAQFTLANIYAQQLFQPDLARKHYLKVLEIEPRHPQAAVIRNWLAANP